MREFVMWWIKTLSHGNGISWESLKLSLPSISLPLCYLWILWCHFNQAFKGTFSNECLSGFVWFLCCFVFFWHSYVRDSRITINDLDLNTILLGSLKMFFEYVCMSALNSTITNLNTQYQWSQTLLGFQILFKNFCCNPSPVI